MAIILTTRSDLAQLERAPLARGLQRACVDGLASWSADRKGLGGRLAASSWAVYGWTRRSAGYEKRQTRGPFGILPYVSPRSKGYGSIGKMLFALTIPGRGHNVMAGQCNSVEADAVMTAPGARGLNFQAGKGHISTYLAEWSRIYPHEEIEISRRIAAVADKRIEEELVA